MSKLKMRRDPMISFMGDPRRSVTREKTPKTCKIITIMPKAMDVANMDPTFAVTGLLQKLYMSGMAKKKHTGSTTINHSRFPEQTSHPSPTANMPFTHVAHPRADPSRPSGPQTPGSPPVHCCSFRQPQDSYGDVTNDMNPARFTGCACCTDDRSSTEPFRPCTLSCPPTHSSPLSFTLPVSADGQGSHVTLAPLSRAHSSLPASSRHGK
mmetsp:Transcript_5049/g.11812  ORF Transcript_5049/g.11812 Transcript_5049/m.11812 type:complete len:210 (-) Transcript_5049:1310-1939(-)